MNLLIGGNVDSIVIKWEAAWADIAAMMTFLEVFIRFPSHDW
jgi:hypothetical protein